MAEELFKSGRNCSQSVFLAFADRYGLDEGAAAKITFAYSFVFSTVRIASAAARAAARPISARVA